MSKANIFIVRGAYKARIKPENRAKYVEALAKRQPTAKAARANALRGGVSRNYPSFAEGASTQAYVARYEKANSHLGLITEGFFQPLSTNPQYRQDDTVIEEVI